MQYISSSQARSCRRGEKLSFLFSTFDGNYYPPRTAHEAQHQLRGYILYVCTYWYDPLTSRLTPVRPRDSDQNNDKFRCYQHPTYAQRECPAVITWAGIMLRQPRATPCIRDSRVCTQINSAPSTLGIRFMSGPYALGTRERSGHFSSSCSWS